MIRSSMGGAIGRPQPTVRLRRVTVRLPSDSLSALRRIPQQVGAAQEHAEIVGERVKLQTDLVLRHRPARQPGPLQSDLALLDVLLGGAALIVEGEDLLRLRRAGW